MTSPSYFMLLSLLLAAYALIDNIKEPSQLYLNQDKSIMTKARNATLEDSAWDVNLVVASLRSEDTSWVASLFPSVNRSIYVVDDQQAALTVPQNKGREAMVYLTYIIDNYHSLPEFNVFLHASRWQWHNDDPIYDGAQVLKKMHFPYLKDQGYVNLRCTWRVGCPMEIVPFATELEGLRDHDIIYRNAFLELFPDIPVPAGVGVSCCAQFAVTRETIRQRKLESYIGYRNWLLATELDEFMSGWVFEYSWHIIFGRPGLHCPPAQKCYCGLFGLCDLCCSEDDCDGQYDLPRYRTLPVSWPPISYLKQ